MQGTHTKLRRLAILGSLTLATSAFGQAVRTGDLRGSVRTAAGSPLAGAFVVVLSSDAAIVGSSYTDRDGRYLIRRLPPGTYDLRASENAYVPALRRALHLRPGSLAVANLTLGALADPATWLPAARRSPEEPDDDWQWTLRSAANRPLLHVFEDDSIPLVASAETPSKHPRRSYQIRVSEDRGRFGHNGTTESLASTSSRPDGSMMRLGFELRSAGPGGSSTAFIAQRAKSLGPGTESRSQVSFEQHSDLSAHSGVSGLQTLRLSGARRIHVGDLASVDAGGLVNVSHAGSFTVVPHPFLRVAVRPAKHIEAGFNLTSSRDGNLFDGAAGLGRTLPGVVASGQTLHEASQLHHALYLQHRSGSTGVIRLAYFHDAPGTTVLTGTARSGLLTPEQLQANLADLVGVEGSLLDTSSMTFRTLGQVHGSSGWSAEASGAIAPFLWLGLSYRIGDALVIRPQNSLVATGGSLGQVRSQAATVAVRSRVLATGTEVRSAYRWQPARTISAVDAFSRSADEPFLSVHLRQSLRWRCLPPGTELTADANNLLAEGYRPFVSNSGTVLVLAQSPRIVSGGVIIDF